MVILHDHYIHTPSLCPPPDLDLSGRVTAAQLLTRYLKLYPCGVQCVLYNLERVSSQCGGGLFYDTATDSPLCGGQERMNHQGFAWQTPGMDQTCPESPERMALQVLTGNSSAEVTYLFIQPLCGEPELQHGLVLTYLLGTYLKWMVGSVWINGNYIAHLLFCLQ